MRKRADKVRFEISIGSQESQKKLLFADLGMSAGNIYNGRQNLFVKPGRGKKRSMILMLLFFVGIKGISGGVTAVRRGGR